MLERDIVYNGILKYLSNEMIYSLISDVELRNKQIIKNSIREINMRLSKIFGNRYKILKKFLRENPVFISGSFITQCILQVDWNNSNIDIYFNLNDLVNPWNSIEGLSENQYKIIRDFLEKKLFHNSKFRNFAYNRADCKSERRGFKLISKLCPESFGIFEYEINNKIIHIILIKDIPGTIASFDFGICSNTYSLNKRVQDNYLKIISFDQLFTRTMKFNYTYDRISSMERHQKYKIRGFKLKNDVHNLFEYLNENKALPILIQVEIYSYGHPRKIFLSYPI